MGAPGSVGRRIEAPVTGVEVHACTIPTDSLESDGTHAWSETTIIIVEVASGDVRGLGYTYASTAAAGLIHDTLAAVVRGCNAMDVGAAFIAMTRAVRNVGRPGIASTAISAVDTALWDLKARLLRVPLASLLGATRQGVDVYGSGGFTSYSIADLQQQLGGWAAVGLSRVKMKVGREPANDLTRVAAARESVGPATELFVDANGAYGRKQALRFAERFADCNVTWFEEPVSSDDLAGLRLLRDRGPAGMAIAAGEYGYTSHYFRQMLEAGAVDVLQADATRCGGITGFLAADALCEAFALPLSAHTAPSLHVAPCCAARRVCHLEYFHDHVRIENLLFDGVPRPRSGRLEPDWSRPGSGLELKRREACRYEVNR